LILRFGARLDQTIQSEARTRTLCDRCYPQDAGDVVAAGAPIWLLNGYRDPKSASASQATIDLLFGLEPNEKLSRLNFPIRVPSDRDHVCLYARREQIRLPASAMRKGHVKSIYSRHLVFSKRAQFDF
jgi:hypothetical protein